MESFTETTARIVDIETRQDDVLRQLEILERRLEQVLAEYAPPASASPAAHLMPAIKAA